MKNSNSQNKTALEEKFFRAETNPEEERRLKETGTHPFFSVLREEKATKMDWRFEDFMEKAEEKPARSVSIFSRFPKIYWAAASILVLVICSIVFYSQYQNPDKKAAVRSSLALQPAPVPNAARVSKPSAQPVVAQNTVPSVRVSAKAGNARASIKNHKKAVDAEKPHAVKQTMPETPDPDTYQPDYVIVNGKPVYSEQEAQSITLKSVAILSNNIEKGIDDFSHIKKIAVKF